MDLWRELLPESACRAEGRLSNVPQQQQPAHALVYLSWRGQFIGRRHGDAVAIGKDIQNISGATLSSTHVTEGIRRLLAIYAIALAAPAA